MKISRWHKGSRDRTKDKPVATVIPSVSHTLDCGLLIFCTDTDGRLVVTLSHTEFQTLAQNMLTLVKDCTYA